jgi:hypothetical protein
MSARLGHQDLSVDHAGRGLPVRYVVRAVL